MLRRFTLSPVYRSKYILPIYQCEYAHEMQFNSTRANSTHSIRFTGRLAGLHMWLGCLGVSIYWCIIICSEAGLAMQYMCKCWLIYTTATSLGIYRNVLFVSKHFQYYVLLFGILILYRRDALAKRSHGFDLYKITDVRTRLMYTHTYASIHTALRKNVFTLTWWTLMPLTRNKLRVYTTRGTLCCCWVASGFWLPGIPMHSRQSVWCARSQTLNNSSAYCNCTCSDRGYATMTFCCCTRCELQLIVCCDAIFVSSHSVCLVFKSNALLYIRMSPIAIVIIIKARGDDEITSIVYMTTYIMYI